MFWLLLENKLIRVGKGDAEGQLGLTQDCGQHLQRPKAHRGASSLG